MVTDTGGIDDKSFNASSWQGMQDAQAADSSKISVKYLQSTTTADYALEHHRVPRPEVRHHRHRRLPDGGATQTAAKSNAGAKFAIVDFPKFPQTNIDSLVFNTVQDGFLGGYLAAGHDQDRARWRRSAARSCRP